MLALTLARITKTSIMSLWRNLWLSLAAVLMMVVTLVSIAFFLDLLVITNKTTDSLKERVDMSVYFNDSATKDQIFAIQNILLSRPDIKSVDYISKEKALDIWRQRNSGNEEISNIITSVDNPLPRSLEIKTEKPEDLEGVYNYLNSNDYKPLLRDISYPKTKNLVDRLVGIAKFLKIVGWSVSITFVFISILVIYNTIRLTIFARSSEIEIMKLVGASDWYVRGPFVIEGIIYGISGAIISSLLFFSVAKYTTPIAENYLGFANFASYLNNNFVIIFTVLLVIGLGLGIFCSFLAMRKYLSK